jgi:hypothetical protein
MEPVIDGKKVVIWTMNQLLAGSAFVLSLFNFLFTLLKKSSTLQPSSAKLTQMSTESEALSTTNIKTATNIEVDLIRIILTFESPRCTVLGNTRINSVKNCWKTFSCRILSAKLTEEEEGIKPFYIDLRDTPTFITEKDIVRQPTLCLLDEGLCISGYFLSP